MRTTARTADRGSGAWLTARRVPATTIHEVLDGLDAIVARARRDGDRLGYFAVLYRTVTARVHDGIRQGFFDDPERMERLDVVFANRFLDAVEAHRAGEAPTQSWEAAFAASARWRPTVLQHLLVAINAHINLDLGIAAAETAPGPALAPMRRDFDRINEILGAVLADVRVTLGAVSPWVGLADRMSGRGEELVNFSIVVARAEAWRFAVELAPLPPDQLAGPIGVRDAGVARIARAVLRPGWLSAPLLLVRSREGFDVARTIDRLAEVPPPSLAAVEARVQR